MAVSALLAGARLEPVSPPQEPFELRWSAPPECPDADTVRRTIEDHLGRAIANELGRGVHITLAATRQDDGLWGTRMTFEGPRGTTVRELADATDCGRAVEAAALVIAIAIDPTLGLGPRETDAVEPTVTEVAAAEPAAALQPESDSERPGEARSTADGSSWARTRGAIGLVVGPTFGGLPRVGGAARLHAAVLRPRWRVELGGAFAGAPRRAVETAKLRVLRWTIDARGCAVITPQPWLEVLPCAGVEIGDNLARAEGLVGSRPRRDVWVGVLGATRLDFVVGPRLALQVGGDVVLPLLRRDYRVAGVGRVHRTAVVTGAVVAGVEVRFP